MSASANPAFADYRNALEDAVSRYSPTLFRVALRRLRNAQDAEDAVQEPCYRLTNTLASSRAARKFPHGSPRSSQTLR